MMRFLVIFAACLSASLGTAVAQAPLFEPTEHFYKMRGAKVAAKWSVDRTELPEDGTLTATLTFEGVANPAEAVRPDLAKVRDEQGRYPYRDRFQIEDVPSAGNGRQPEFVWKLRPRSTQVNRLPTFEFWYDSGVKAGNPYRKGRAAGIDLVVTPAVKPPPPVVPILEPDELFKLRPVEMPVYQPKPPGPEAWLFPFVLGAVVAGTWFWVWRRIYPDGARLAKLRRSRALRQASDAIRRAGHSDDPAGTVAAALIGYLRSRYHLPAGSETPGEVANAVEKAGVSAENATLIAAFLQKCDAARFAPASDNPLSLAAEAQLVLARLEALA
jgi:hypothetical protein